jgi:hypothetical protein
MKMDEQEKFAMKGMPHGMLLMSRYFFEFCVAW